MTFITCIINRGDNMSFFDTLMEDIIVMLFPIMSILLIKAYTKNIGEFGKDILIDIANFSSLFLLIKYCHTNLTYDVVIVNIPLVISILYNRKSASVLIALFLMIFNYEIGNNIFVVMIEYLLYILIIIPLNKKKICYKNLLLIFICIKGISLTIKEYYILGNNNITSLFQIFICLIVFYLVSILVVKIINKIEETISLNQTLKELEKEKNLKNSLFKITHEVKNPIAVCKGYLSMMDYNNIEKVKKYNEIILSEIDRTLDIMDNFSEYTKINVDLDLMDLDELISDTITGLKPIFKESNIEINYNYNDEIFINGDYKRLKQVLINTLKNSVEAIKGEGLITLKIRKTKKFVYLYIRDNGSGMTKEELDKIGELFYSSKQKGCGVGVTLSKEIVKLHGGELTYKSVFGEYTEAIIKLPTVNSLQ